MRAVLLGPPGAGKGTQAERLCQAHRLLHLSTGDLLRAAVAAGTRLGKEAKGSMDRGELVPDRLVLSLLEERLAKRAPGEGFLLDGFPRSIAQARALERVLKDEPIDHVVYLQLDDDEVLRRLLMRGRPDDREDVIRNRLAVYRAQTEPLVVWYRDRRSLRSIDGRGSMEEVHARVLAALRSAEACS